MEEPPNTMIATKLLLCGALAAADNSFWTNACVFRAMCFEETDEIVSILVSAIDRETAAMRRIMKEVQWSSSVIFFNCAPSIRVFAGPVRGCAL